MTNLPLNFTDHRCLTCPQSNVRVTTVTFIRSAYELLRTAYAKTILTDDELKPDVPVRQEQLKPIGTSEVFFILLQNRNLLIFISNQYAKTV
jgi:hypothetical protein